MRGKKTAKMLNADALRKVFPELRSAAGCVLATLVNAVCDSFCQEILEQSNLYSVTDSRKISNYHIQLVFAGEIIDCYVNKENVDSTGKYPLHVVSTLTFEGGEDVVPRLFELLEKSVKEKKLDYWKSCALSGFQNPEEVEVLKKDIREFYGI